MAHRLPDYNWKCWNVHWHTYKALITVEWDIYQWHTSENGMVMDFWWFKKVKDWIDEHRDHAYVWRKDDYVLEYLKEKNFRTYTFDFSPTAEQMSRYLFEIVDDLLWTKVKVKSVTIYETPTSFSTYSE